MEAAVVGMLLGATSEWRRTLLEWALEKKAAPIFGSHHNPAVRIVDLQVAAEQRKEHNSKDEEHSKDDMSRNSVMLKKYKFRAPKANYDHGQFQWGETLGSGTYSKVMKATLKESGAVYALKMMNKVQIFEEQKTNYVKMERMILDFLQHPGVVRLLFTFQDNESLYMGMECCDGGELRGQMNLRGRAHVGDIHLHRPGSFRGRFSSSEARFYAAELVDALEYIHGQGIVHRDIRPENILVMADGHIKIIDFGSAKMLRPMPDGIIVQIEDTRPEGALLGTAEYISPEVLNRYTVTNGADLWALGCIIFEMLEGKRAFQAEDDDHLYQQVTSRQFRIPSNFSPEAKDLVDSLLDLVPERRPGAGPRGYAALKSHPFFSGVDWDKVREANPPPVVTTPVLRVDESLEVHYPPLKPRSTIFSKITDQGYVKEIALT